MTTTTRRRPRPLGNLEDADRRLYRCNGCGAWRYRPRYLEGSMPAHFCRRARP